MPWKRGMLGVPVLCVLDQTNTLQDCKWVSEEGKEEIEAIPDDSERSALSADRWLRQAWDRHAVSTATHWVHCSVCRLLISVDFKHNRIEMIPKARHGQSVSWSCTEAWVIKKLVTTQRLSAISVKTKHFVSQASSKFDSTLFQCYRLTIVELVLDNRSRQNYHLSHRHFHCNLNFA